MSLSRSEFENQMNKKYGNNGGFDFSTMVFKASKTTLKCNKCQAENTKSALRHLSCTCSNCYSNMSQRSNNETFINSVQTKFGIGKFEFDKLNYTNAITKVTLYCNEHGGDINITPNKFLSGKGCNVCNKNTPYTIEEFVNICIENYGNDDFDFTETKYTNQKTKVTVYCKKGNHFWEVDPKTLLVGKTHCGECSGKGGRSSAKFIEIANEKHSNLYTYEKVNYINAETKVLITCPIDGDFTQTPKSHLSGRGCPKCGKYGYQPSKPGYFYVQKLESPSKTVYKYGITGDMTRRVTEQSRNSVYTHTVLVERYFEDGKQPLALEKFIKTFIASGVSTIEELPSGFTETFDAQYLNIVLEIVNSFNSKEED